MRGYMIPPRAVYRLFLINCLGNRCRPGRIAWIARCDPGFAQESGVSTISERMIVPLSSPVSMKSARHGAPELDSNVKNSLFEFGLSVLVPQVDVYKASNELSVARR